MGYEIGKISILCPTGNRPDNVIRLVNLARSNARHPDLVEFLFYVDEDDDTFPDIDNVITIRGPRVWISNAHNVLYGHASGEILMTAGDDMEFLTKDWDYEVKNRFEGIPDRIGLVFGNDLGTHAGKIAVHGFFHRKWIETLGSWVQPGRGSLWDLWSTEVAQSLDRLFYLPNVNIKHIHYRQGAKEAAFDSTYQYVYSNNTAFNPMRTYKLLARERRIDHILLSEKMEGFLPVNSKYFLGTMASRFFLKRVSLEKKRKLLLSTNLEICVLPIRVFYLRVLRRRTK